MNQMLNAMTFDYAYYGLSRFTLALMQLLYPLGTMKSVKKSAAAPGGVWQSTMVPTTQTCTAGLTFRPTETNICTHRVEYTIVVPNGKEQKVEEMEIDDPMDLEVEEVEETEDMEIDDPMDVDEEEEKEEATMEVVEEEEEAAVGT